MTTPQSSQLHPPRATVIIIHEGRTWLFDGEIVAFSDSAEMLPQTRPSNGLPFAPLERGDQHVLSITTRKGGWHDLGVLKP